MSKLSPFDFIKSINEHKPNLLKDCKAYEGEELISSDTPSKQYVPFIINRGFSQFNDTVLLEYFFTSQSSKGISLKLTLFFWYELKDGEIKIILD